MPTGQGKGPAEKKENHWDGIPARSSHMLDSHRCDVPTALEQGREPETKEGSG